MSEKPKTPTDQQHKVPQTLLMAVPARPPKGQPENVLSRREAARRAGVHYNTIKSWEKSGRLPSTRIGKRIWIKVADLDKAVAAG